MFSDPNIIVLEGLQIYPSETYLGQVFGLFNTHRETNYADLMGNGTKKGASKILSKTINIDIWLKDRSSILPYIELNRILNRDGLKLEVYFDEIGWLQTTICIESRLDDDNGVKLSLVATMPDPYLYKRDDKIVNLKFKKEGGIYIGSQPQSFPITFNTKVSGNQGELDNEGLYPTWSIVEIKGACSEIEIYNKTTGQQMKVNVDLGSEDTLIIDSRLSTRGIYLNGKRRPDLKNGDWLSVPIGKSEWIFNRISTNNDTTRAFKSGEIKCGKNAVSGVGYNSRQCRISFREVFI